MQSVKTLIPILWFLIIALGHKVSGLGVVGTALTSNELDIDNHLCKAENIKVNEYFCSRITKRPKHSAKAKKNSVFCLFCIFGSFPAESVDTIHWIVRQPCYSEFYPTFLSGSTLKDAKYTRD